MSTQTVNLSLVDFDRLGTKESDLDLRPKTCQHPFIHALSKSFLAVHAPYPLTLFPLCTHTVLEIQVGSNGKQNEFIQRTRILLQPYPI